MSLQNILYDIFNASQMKEILKSDKSNNTVHLHLHAHTFTCTGNPLSQPQKKKWAGQAVLRQARPLWAHTGNISHFPAHC